MGETLPSQIIDYLEDRGDAMFELLETFVRIESPSREPATHAEMLDVLGHEFSKRGYRPRVLPGKASGGMLVATPDARPRGRPHQLVIGHADTVWPVGTIETMPVKVEEGVFWGPGSYDMKAGLVQGLFAVEALTSIVGEPLAVTPVFLVNSDEEIGSHDSTRAIARFARGADRCFVLEPSLGAEGKLKTGRKGVGRFTIRVQGQAAHAGLDPTKGASAILELSHVIQELFALNDLAKGITVNVGTIDGGMSPNVVAPESSAVVDVRVPTKEDAARIESTIHSLRAKTPGTKLTIEGAIGRPPMEQTPGNKKLWLLAQRGADELGLRVGQAFAGGGSDGNTTSQYAPTLDGLGAVGGGAHAPSEHLELARMVERSALLARLLSFPPLTEVS